MGVDLHHPVYQRANWMGDLRGNRIECTKIFLFRADIVQVKCEYVVTGTSHRGHFQIVKAGEP